MKNVPGKISFVLDAWTSPNILGFLGITCHYIDANWKLRDILLDFVYLEGSHSGENLANAFLKCLEEKKIFTKVKYILIYIMALLMEEPHRKILTSFATSVCRNDVDYITIEQHKLERILERYRTFTLFLIVQMSPSICLILHACIT